MSRSQYGPAAGAKGGPAPRLAKPRQPDFLRFDSGELHPLYDVLRDPLVAYVYVQLVIYSDFVDGHFLGDYATLMDLATPPKPQQGPRRKGPTYKQVRRAVDDLVSVGLVVRGDQNAAQGELRLWVRPRKGNGAPPRKAGRS